MVVNDALLAYVFHILHFYGYFTVCCFYLFKKKKAYCTEHSCSSLISWLLRLLTASFSLVLDVTWWCVCSDRLYRLAAQERQAVPCGPGVQQARPPRFASGRPVMFAQGRNRLIMHFSERVPIAKVQHSC